MTAVVHDHSLPTVGADSAVKPGDVLLEVKNVELRFGGPECERPGYYRHRYADVH